jgi:hypothetical protein
LRFFILIQSFDRPPRYGRSRRFDTSPSIWHKFFADV